MKRAPYFFRKTGTEWIYRLIKQPRRIRRHIAIWIFIFRVIKIWVKKKLKF
ncbi:MAG: WecB/TagA/CpsF family glycosyltransferase [candidate division WOR-3 bacterium]